MSDWFWHHYLLTHADCRNAGTHLCSRVKVWWYVGHGPGEVMVAAVAVCAAVLLAVLWSRLRP